MPTDKRAMRSAGADFFEIVGAKCPECGGRLQPSTGPYLFCPAAIGEMAYDTTWRRQYFPEGAQHTTCRWLPSHPAIVAQVEGWEARSEERASKKRTAAERMREAQVA